LLYGSFYINYKETYSGEINKKELEKIINKEQNLSINIKPLLKQQYIEEIGLKNEIIIKSFKTKREAQKLLKKLNKIIPYSLKFIKGIPDIKHKYISAYNKKEKKGNKKTIISTECRIKKQQIKNKKLINNLIKRIEKLEKLHKNKQKEITKITIIKNKNLFETEREKEIGKDLDYYKTSGYYYFNKK
jgi:hypothetical protein